MPTMYTIEEHEAQQVKPYIDSHIATLSNEVDTLTNLVEGATEITTKSFAPVIAINDALPVNAVDVLAKIEPIQAGSGTPSPTNVRAISGRTEVTVTRAGKNLIEETIVGTNMDSTGVIVSYDNSYDLHIAKVKKDVTYSLGVGSSQYVYGFFTNKPTRGARTYNGNRVVVNNIPTFIAPIDGYIAFRTITGYTIPQCMYNNFTGSYEAPNVNDYTIQLGDTYYGGTLDVTTGVFTVDRGYAEFDGSDDENWGWAGNTSLFSILVDNAFITDNTTQYNKYTLNNLFPDTSWANKTDDGSVGLIWGASAIFLKYGTLGSTISDLKSFLTSNPLQVVYKLATPITVQLTPQEIQMLQGNNTIFTDSGDTSIQYYANGVKNLEASVSAIQNDTNDLKALTAIFGTFENGTTASKPYAQGDYFVKNNKMCKAKTSIAKGATLTLNTNYEEKTLAEILKTIETA